VSGAFDPSVTVDFAPLGIAVGHASDEEGGTGLTVVRGVGFMLEAEPAPKS
jgi:hypothetical protein